MVLFCYSLEFSFAAFLVEGVAVSLAFVFAIYCSFQLVVCISTVWYRIESEKSIEMHVKSEMMIVFLHGLVQ